MKIAVMIMTLATLGTFHAAGYSAVLRAFEDNELNYLGFILQRFYSWLSSWSCSTSGLEWSVSLSPTCSRTYSCGPSTTSSFPSFTPRLSCKIDLPLWKELFFSAVPMGGGVMLRQLAMQIDILFWD